MTLPTDASINLGVVVIEWITNAFKYAYPEGRGEVRVRLKRLSPDRAELVVEDDGVGRDARPSQGTELGTGLGTRIVKAAAAALKGDIEYLDRRPGTAARLTFGLQPV